MRRHQYRNLKEDPDKNICDLPSKLMIDLINDLDRNPETTNWRAFINTTAKFYKDYTFSYQDVEKKIGNCIYSHGGTGSPSRALISELGALGMRAEELAHILDELKLERILMYLKRYERIEIVQQPTKTIQISEGDELRLEVEGVGFPYPRYQWFKLNPKTMAYDMLEGGNLRVLKVEHARNDDSGTYCCRLHNGQGDSQIHFSSEAAVIVEKHGVTHIMDERPGKDYNPGYPDAVMKDRTVFYRQKDVHPEKAVLPYILEHPKTCQIIKGATLVLNCPAVGRLPLEYIWYKNGHFFTKTDDSFLKISENQSQIGTYHCVVKNAFGEVRSEEAIVTVSEAVLPMPGNVEIEIISNPKSCVVEIGGNCIFSCEARCRGQQLCYEWYKDGKKIEGEYKGELKLYKIQDMEMQGSYMCMVSVPEIKLTRMSNIAVLNIKNSPDRPPEFNPTDKVALLIGNYDYRNESPLKAPEADVSTLQQMFRSLDFKVVSLLNLTKTEMLSAVDVFSELLGKGVYAVFYFCGHGFEEDGKCYFVPPDAKAGYTIEDCVSAENVLYRMSKPDPDLIVSILDICRIRNRVDSPKAPVLDIPQKGNTFFFYATSQGMYAYEDQVNGILVKYLQRFMLQPKGIYEIFSQVQEAIGKEPKHYKLQIPEIKSNLLQPRRSLADKISTKGATELYHKRTLHWLQCHQKPKKRTIDVELLDMQLEMEFQSDFSNVLHVITNVKKMGKASEALAYISTIPSTVYLKSNIQPANSPTRTKATLQEVQKLTENLVVEITVKYKLKDEKECDHCKIYKCTTDLGLPLVSVLKLWKPKENEATEHEESSDKHSNCYN